MTKKPYLKDVETHITQSVNEATGELLDVITKKQSIIVNNDEEFITLYNGIIGLLGKIPGNAMSVLTIITFKHITPTGKAILNKATKEEIAKDLKMSPSSIRDYVKCLIAQEVLLPTDARSVYKINPLFIWKGRSAVRKQELKYTLEVKRAARREIDLD